MKNNTLDANNKITFIIDGCEVLELHKDGFYYNGDKIDDAGKAHEIFIECMEYMHKTVVKGMKN